jgi:hypothetical protein
VSFDRSFPARLLPSGAWSGDDSGCTTQQRNAHVTERRVVLYRWHPWHGRAVLIVSVVTKGTARILRCRLDDDSRALEVPQWMFETSTCCRMRQAPAAVVTCQALRELRKLVDMGSEVPSSSVLQDEHPIPDIEGGAHAIQEPTAFDQSAAVVPSERAGAMERRAGGRAQSHRGTSRAPTAPTRTRTSRDGGAR